MTRTAGQERDIRALAETESQRALAREVSCDDCRALIDQPCRTPLGGQLRAEHPGRIRKAERARSADVLACTACQRLKLTEAERESTPWPEQVEMCEWHRRVAAEIREAREMGCDWP
jgi:hypothetical protein